MATAQRAILDLLPLLKTHSVQDIRDMIGVERRDVLRAFDLLSMRIPKNPERHPTLELRKRCNGRALSPELRTEIISVLRAGWSQRRILERYPVGPGAVLKLSKQVGASFLKPGGRGRRFAPETWQRIVAAVKSGRASCDIQREFTIDYGTTRKIRRQLGDFANRRKRLKITAPQIVQAEALLRAGETWRNAAHAVGLSPTTIIKHCKFRKRAEGLRDEGRN